MYLFTTVLFAVLVLSSSSVLSTNTLSVKQNSRTEILTERRKKLLQEKIKAAGGCSANVCFAIDGSGSIPGDEFDNEKNFVLDVVSVVVKDPVELAAVQYATSNYEISRLTANDESFILKVNRTEQVGGWSFVAAGINYCFSQLYRQRDQPNHIVLLGDGRSNIGADAIRRSDLFRRVGGTVSVVGAGWADNSILLQIAGGDPNLVHEVDNFLDVLTLEIFIEDIVKEICDL